MPASAHPATLSPLVLDRRFAGPPGSGNGGYVAGRLAAYLAAAPGSSKPVQGTQAVEVTLRQPPPLETPLHVGVTSAGVRAAFGGIVVAEAVPARLDVEPVEPVGYDEALAAQESYRGHDAHPYPSCFACGTARPVPDGLGLRPGPLPDRPDTTATTWRPDASLVPAGHEEVPAELAWAALDCPGGWAVDVPGRPLVLGQMTAVVDALPRVGDGCVVVGRALGRQGRKAFTATTLYDGDGRVLGRAHAVWITVGPAGAQRPGEQ